MAPTLLGLAAGGPTITEISATPTPTTRRPWAEEGVEGVGYPIRVSAQSAIARAIHACSAHSHAADAGCVQYSNSSNTTGSECWMMLFRAPRCHEMWPCGMWI